MADAFIAALDTFRTELIALAANCYGNALDAFNSSIAAATQASASATSATESAASATAAATAGNAFASLKPERATQLDVGGQWKGEGWQAWAS